MIHLTTTLEGWGDAFGARKGIFRAAAKDGALGIKGRCITRTEHSIDLDMWFRSEDECARFTAGLSNHPDGIGDPKIEKAVPPQGIEQIYFTHYVKDEHSPNQEAMTGSSRGLTKANDLSVKLVLQRLDSTGEGGFDNMNIIPAALLDDDKRKLKCEWLFLSASPTFHRWFDGPDTAPSIQISIVGWTESDDRHVDFKVRVDTTKVQSGTLLAKPSCAQDVRGVGYDTVVKVRRAQAENFQMAVEWRHSCVAAAWEKSDAGHTVTLSGRNAWFRLEELPPALQVAISEAKKAAGIVAEDEEVDEALAMD